MKLASLKKGRDGELIVVSRDLQQAVCVPEIASTLQQVMENWPELSPQLQQVSDALNGGNRDNAFAFDPKVCAAPLPRAYQWADGSAYVNHVELVRRARKAEVPDSFWHDPLIYQGGSDSFIGPCDDVPLENEDWGIDFEAEIAVITDDVAMGSSPEQCVGNIRLLMLVNDVSLRSLISAEHHHKVQ